MKRISLATTVLGKVEFVESTEAPSPNRRASECRRLSRRHAKQVLSGLDTRFGCGGTALASNCPLARNSAALARIEIPHHRLCLEGTRCFKTLLIAFSVRKAIR